MCRWLGYFGNPIRPDWLLYRTSHGLIDQSLSAREMDHPINGDGFGLGWYGTAPLPGLYRNIAPAWSDPNLRELCAQLETRCSSRSSARSRERRTPSCSSTSR